MISTAFNNKDKLDEGIKINRDRTELQRQLLKEAFQELQTKNIDGKKKYQIRYIRDIPRVVKKVNKNVSSKNIKTTG